MDYQSANEVMARLAEGHCDDDRVVACARWAAHDGKRLAWFREAWPINDLPVVKDEYFCLASLGQGGVGCRIQGTPARGGA